MSGIASKIVTFVTALVAGLATPALAHAYCRTMSCELGEAKRVESTGKACQRDANACVTDGTPLHWGSACIDYAVQIDGSPKLGLDGDTFQQAVAQAFAAWEGARCPGGGSPRFHARFQGFASCNRVEHVCGGAGSNVNVIMFHDQGWTGEAGVLGLTEPSGGTTTGLLVDADLELNSQDYQFSVGPFEAGGFALEEVLAHELGHFLGLGHSKVSGALMSVDYETLALSRELLAPDDVAAICAAYPPGAQLDCPAPQPPAYDACQLPPGAEPDCVLPTMRHREREGGCSIGRATPARGLGLTPLLFGVLLRRLWSKQRRS